MTRYPGITKVLVDKLNGLLSVTVVGGVVSVQASAGVELERRGTVLVATGSGSGDVLSVTCPAGISFVVQHSYGSRQGPRGLFNLNGMPDNFVS